MPEWFSVKSVYQSIAIGQPKNIDRSYDPNITMVEERIVTFKAKNFKEAFKKAEKEAKKYAKYTYVNLFSQKVVTKYLGAFEAFNLYAKPNHASEVFSYTRLISKKNHKKKIKELLFSKKENKKLHEKRRNFFSK